MGLRQATLSLGGALAATWLTVAAGSGAVTAMATGEAAPAPTSVVDAPVDAGAVSVVEAGDGTTAIADARSGTIFTLRLPADATCPGDSRFDQWRIQSFVVPVADDPGGLSYNEIGPDGADQWALYGVDQNPYVHVVLAANAAPGQPGRIEPVEPLSFAVFPPGTIADGAYRIGLACTHFGTTAKYWDAEVQFVTDVDDEPGQLSWRVVGAPPATSSEDGGVGWRAPVVIGFLVVAGLAAIYALRQRSGTFSKEHA